MTHGAKRTREHAIPSWLEAHLAGDDEAVFTATVESGEHGGVLRRWSSRQLNLVTKRVCASCNNGWMSRLETDAQPLLMTMLRGHRRTFYRGGQETLAGWAIKTALALGMLHPDRYEPITAQHYRRIAQANGRPGDACQVFLGAYRGTVVVNHQLRRLAINAEEDDMASAFLSTFVVGPVLFQVFFHDYREPVTIDRASGTLEWVSQIWPCEEPATWPPKRLADADVLGQLKEGLSPMVEGRYAWDHSGSGASRPSARAAAARPPSSVTTWRSSRRASAR
jgi:hypothetical protein